MRPVGAAWFFVSRFPFKSSACIPAYLCILVAALLGWSTDLAGARRSAWPLEGATKSVMAAVIPRASPGPNLRYHYLRTIFSQLLQACTW